MFNTPLWQNLKFAREDMAENKTIQDKDLGMPCKHKNHTSLKHIGRKLACQYSSCKRPLKGFPVSELLH